MTDLVKTIGGIISAIITLVVIIPILSAINSQLQVPNFDILNIVIPLIFLAIIIKILQEVFDL